MYNTFNYRPIRSSHTKQPFLRRLITRCISLIPSMVVAIAVGRQGINSLLVVSQVILSIVLPFVAFPLIYLTSSEVVMRVRVTPPDAIERETPPLQRVASLDFPSEEIQVVGMDIIQPADTPEDTPNIYDEMPEIIDFSNGLLLTTLSYIIWGVVFLANAYAIVMLILRAE